MTTFASTDLIAELEHVVRAGSPERRIQILRQVTSLLLADADRLNEHHIGVFDDVLVRLMACVDGRTLAKLSALLAGLRTAPKGAIRHLAQHEDAAVAAPIVLKSESLSECDLIEIAGERGQQHLLAIAARTTVSPALADLLLKRGDGNVYRALARNPGAQFSSSGLAALVDAAERDDDVADSLAFRPDMPKEALYALISKSSPVVQARLLKTAPSEKHEAIRAAIESTAAGARVKQPISVDYSEAKATVLALNKSGKLNDSTVNRFAVRREYKNLIAALSLLATAPIETIEQLMEEVDYHGLIIACRASRLNWQTTAAVICNRQDRGPIPPQELAHGKDTFETLVLSTAQRSIRFSSVSELAARPGLISNALAGVN